MQMALQDSIKLLHYPVLVVSRRSGHVLFCGYKGQRHFCSIADDLFQVILQNMAFNGLAFDSIIANKF